MVNENDDEVILTPNEPDKSSEPDKQDESEQDTALKDFAMRVAKARRSVGMSESELAEKLGVSVQQLNDWESGRAYPDVATLPKLARLLKADVDYLLTGDMVYVPPAQPIKQAPKPSASAQTGKKRYYYHFYYDEENARMLKRRYLFILISSIHATIFGIIALIIGLVYRLRSNEASWLIAGFVVFVPIEVAAIAGYVIAAKTKNKLWS